MLQNLIYYKRKKERIFEAMKILRFFLFSASVRAICEDCDYDYDPDYDDKIIGEINEESGKIKENYSSFCSAIFKAVSRNSC